MAKLLYYVVRCVIIVIHDVVNDIHNVIIVIHDVVNVIHKILAKWQFVNKSLMMSILTFTMPLMSFKIEHLKLFLILSCKIL